MSTGRAPTGTGARRPLRWAFGLYALVLVLATHWPDLRVPDVGGFTRTDLAVHLAACSLWTALLIACAFFGPRLSTRNIARSAAVAALYATIDEFTQGLPGIHRQVSALDWSMNLGGVAIATIVAASLAAATGRRAPREQA